jgi:hypothetical protein
VGATGWHPAAVLHQQQGLGSPVLWLLPLGRGRVARGLGGWVCSDFGLFPASDPGAQVLLESLASPSGYGSCSLSARELENLWDVPILFLDSLADEEVTGLMGVICRSPPTKLLHTGTDLLLTSVFWGGLEFRQGLEVRQGQEELGQGQEGATVGNLPGPHPCSDADLGLSPVCKRHCPSETLNMEELTTSAEVIKGDSQKADNAAVPDHLWLRAFVQGYGTRACAACHLEMLGWTEGTVGFLEGPELPTGWQGALPGLRLFALRYWCSRVTKGYIFGARPMYHSPLPVRGGELVLYHWKWQQGVEYPVYEWLATGRQGYQTEWRITWASADGKATVEAGHDATYHCTDATWFEWPKGSAPFFGIGGQSINKRFEMGNPTS